MNARGMPDVDLSDATKERLAEEKKEAEPKPNLEIFVKPIDENNKETAEPTESKVSDEKIKEVTEEIKKETIQSDKQKKVPKPKRKLTDKQLDALRRGREKSIETRRKNKEAKELKKAEKTIEQKAPEKLVPPMPQYPPQNMPQMNWQPPQIDYEKIINGLASKLEQQSALRNEREHIVAENVNAFESKIREDERNKVINEIDNLQKEEDKKRASIMAHKYLSKPKPQVDSNPYAYALQMGANSRYRRY